MQFIGREIDFGVAIEGDRGVAEAAAERTIRKVTTDLLPQEEKVTDNTTFGRLEDSERTRTVRSWNEGGLDGIIHADSLGYFLTNLYGDVDSSNVTGDVYEHEFTLAQNILHPTLTLFLKDAEVDQVKVANGVVSEFGLSMTTDDFLRFNASFLGKKSEEDSSELPALEKEYDFISRDITAKVAGTEGGLNGASATKMKSLDINWNPNAEADWVFGDRDPDNIYNKQFSIEGEFTKNFVDTQFKDLYESDDSIYMRINVEGEENLGGGNKPELTILLNKVQITDWSRSSDADELSTETVEFKAFFNVDDVQQSKVNLVNTTEAYTPQS